MRYLMLFVGGICVPIVASGACPDGFKDYRELNDVLIRNANGECSELCGAGITSLNTSTGYKFDLFSSKNTAHAIHIKSGDTVCYADLISGSESGTLNVSLDGATYSANPNSGQICSVTYTLTYSCGDDTTGTAPESQELVQNALFVVPYDAGTCRKPGYDLSGWKIDDNVLALGGTYSYTYETDKTMVAQWAKNVDIYGGAIMCNYCPDEKFNSTAYISGTYDTDFTPPLSPSCTNPQKQEVVSYRVYDAWGNDTGETIIAGTPTKWKWPYNIRLEATWTDPSLEQPGEYMLSYDCGGGAIGTPPESHPVVYNQFFTAPYDAGSCSKPGYYLNNWKIGSTGISKGSIKQYTYTDDKTMVAQWSKNSYGGAYLCDNNTVATGYITATYGSTVTPSTTACAAVDGAVFAGWRILDLWGNDTGDIVAPSSSFVWDYSYNIQLVAMWE